jgi:O-antigen biosynthesis protein
VSAAAAHAPRLLFVDVKRPTPQRDAASQRSMQLLCCLAGLGYDVDFAAMFPLPEDDPVDLGELGVRSLEAADETAIAAHVAGEGRRYATVVLCWTRVARRLIGPVRQANAEAFVVFDTVDVNHVREYRQARVTGNASILRRALATRAAELAVVSAADCTLAVTPVDVQTLRRGCPEARVELVTMAAPAVDGIDPRPEGREGILLLGSMQAAPNVDAATHLVRDIVPRMDGGRARVPITLAGGDPPEVVRELAGDGVRVPGFVADAQRLLGTHRVFASPLRFGSGIKGKLLLALAHGLPIVATPMAVEGMDIEDGRHALVADGSDAFARALARLLDDERLWQELSWAGRLLAAERYGPATVEAQVAGVFCAPS